MSRRQLPIAVIWIIAAQAVLALAQETHVGNLAGDAKAGKALYQRYCLYCHGTDGDGRGDSSPYLDPKPRDFTLGVFKCRSTPTGTLPSDKDLYETISRGIHGSGMPSWRPLTRHDRANLVAYVKTFSPRFREDEPGKPMEIPPEPRSSPESIQRGAELYESMNCGLCHGKEGRGNGPSAASLTDSKGNTIRPADLTQGNQFKCADSDEGVFRDLLTGLDGTPMPSFAKAATPEQLWDLVHYITSLRPKKTGHVFTAKVTPYTH